MCPGCRDIFKWTLEKELRVGSRCTYICGSMEYVHRNTAHQNMDIKGRKNDMMKLWT
jgi:hypothetical protein